MITNQLRTEMLQYAQSLEQNVIQIRRDLHAHPELLYDTERTGKIVADALASWNIEVEENVGKHFGKGVVGRLQGSAGHGPHLLLRADMDALPIEEMNDISYRSLYPGVMHACGHDAHTAMLLGTARTLAHFRDKLKGSFTFVFQPAEEGALPSPIDGRLLSGGRDMIEDNILQGIDYCYAMHVWPQLPTGTLAVHDRYAMAASSHFTITFHGKGGHHSTPHLAIDAIAMMVSYISMIDGVMAREINPLEQAVLVFGKIQGGTVTNSIAEQCVASGTFRAFNKDVVNRISFSLEHYAKHIAASFGGAYKLELREGMAVVNDPMAIEQVLAAGELIFGKNSVKLLQQGSLAGEDFGWYLDQVPGAFAFIGCSPPSLEKTIGLHEPQFNIDEGMLNYGVQLFVQLALQHQPV